MTSRGGNRDDRIMPQPAALPDNRAREGEAGFPQRARKPSAETALARTRRLAQFMPLVEAWRSPGPGRTALAAAERDLLAIVHLSVQQDGNLLIRLPGGLYRLPLLAAAMIAAGSLEVPESELTRLSGADPPPGPVALVTTRMVRRGELDRLDAASAPVAPALHPHRLRGDGLMSPVRGGRPRLVTGAARLLFVAPVTGFPAILGVAPRVVVIDAASEPGCEWLTLARSWACAHGSTVVTVTDLHQDVEPLPVGSGMHLEQAPRTGTASPAAPAPAGHHENWWIADWPWLNDVRTPLAASSAPSPDRPGCLIPAGGRGRAHLLTVEDPALSGLGEARQRLGRLRDPAGRAAPWPVRQAARLTRLLTELPTRTGDYDRVAPRYGGRTLRRLLDDILDADARNDFPASWRTRVAADWGAVRVALTTVYEALTARNPLTDVIADLVEDAYLRRQQLDIICGSRSAREALTGRLASFGTLRIQDSPLVTIRSINTVDAAGAHEVTLLVGPPAARWRQRLTAADLGQLVIISTSACSGQVYYALGSAYGEPSREEARQSRCATLTALTGAAADEDELDGPELPLGVTTQRATRSPAVRISLPDPSALLTAALAEPSVDKDLDLGDLEAEPDDDTLEPEPGTLAGGRQAPAIPVLIRSTAVEETSPPTAVLLPAAGRVQRLRGDEIRLLAVTGITAGMILIGISEPERRTLFDRIRPLLGEQRPQEAALLLQLWRIALDDARSAAGSVAELTARLSTLGSEVTEGTVRKWSDPARIGPIDPVNVARIGRIAGSGVVAGETGRIAAVMREARIRHAAVGSAIVKLAGWQASGDNAALDRAAETLGAEITDLAAELTAWRVIAVGEAVLAPASVLRRPMAVDEITRISQPVPQAAMPSRPPDGAEAAETAFLSSQPPSDQEES
jgi:hypothetical protein